MKPRFLTDAKGRKQGVILSMKEYKSYKRMIEKQEMDADILAYDKALEEYKKNPKTYTLEEVKKKLGYI